MNSKQLVLTGIVITSLLTTLILNDILPGLALAVIILLTGLTLTYYIGLNKKRMEKMLEMKMLIQAGKCLHQEGSISGIVEQLRFWVMRMVKSESTFIMVPFAEPTPTEGTIAWQEWEEVNKKIIENKKTLIINRGDSDFSFEDLSDDINSFIGVPLKLNDRVLGVLYQINKKDNGLFNEHDQMILETISEQASQAIEKTFAYQEMRSRNLLIIKSIVRTVEARNPIFIGHAERVTAISKIIGCKLGLDKNEIESLEYSAMLHDIGYLEVQAEENEKGFRHLPEEHPLLGSQMLPPIGILTEVRKGILYHHERYNGEGYPEGLCRDEIPFVARIIAVADVYDVLTRLSQEKIAVSHDTAVKEIKKATGSLFDPLVVVAFEEVGEEIKANTKKHQ